MTTAFAPGPIYVGGVACTVVGTGGPVTVFAHGLGGSCAETRPLAAGVPGTRVLLDFRGHGDSVEQADGWDYDLLADDLLEVADAFGATRAVGLSVGSGALLRALTRDPDRFERLVMVLPAALDRARDDGATLALRSLGQAIDAGDVEAITGLLLAEVPEQVRSRRAVRLLLGRRARQLAGRPAPRPRRADRPVHDRRVLGAVRAPALVVAQQQDPLHTVEIATELAASLPNSRLLTLGPAGVFWTGRELLATQLAHHLSEEPV